MYKALSRLCLILVVASPVWAQAPQADVSGNEIERAKGLWEPAEMMQRACDGISLHYKLDPKQKEFTSKLLTDRVTKFLTKHEKQLWPLLMELTQLQLEGHDPDAATAKRISEKGYHIFADAQSEILKAQDEFRKILTEEQKKVHDRDLKGLNRQFQNIDSRFSKWKAGDTSGGNPIGPVRLGHPGNRILPERPGKTGPSRPRILHESKWDQYVTNFIAHYKLDDAQKTTALAILKSVKADASQYRRSHRADLADAETHVREAQMAKPFDKKALATARKIRDLRNKPFEDWFNDLKNRLDQIPTENQKADYYKRFPHLKPTTQDAKPKSKQAGTQDKAKAQSATPADKSKPENAPRKQPTPPKPQKDAKDKDAKPPGN